ncbi:MAG TPA: TraR/DksA family transcriptional regulator [Rhizobacter sp.]
MPAPSVATAALAEQLQQRARELEREIADAELAAAPAGAGVTDRKDEADRLAATVIRDAEVERDRAELREVYAALDRLAAGRYGECTQCGAPIAEARLKAMPSAALCISCQAREEHRRNAP